MKKDFAFEMSGSNLRFGPGVTHEVGLDLKEMSAGRVMVLTDPHVAQLPPVDVVRESLDQAGIEFDLFDQVRVEPSDKSFQAAIDVASAVDYEAYVAVGGGSSIDTAKAANLYATWPADFMDYVNAPIGSLVRDYHPLGYPDDHAIAPHGIAVVLTAPAVFRYTASGCPDRHLYAAGCLGADINRASPNDVGQILCDAVRELLRKLDLPNGLSAIGFDSSDIPALVEGTLPQQIRHLASRPAEADELAQLFEESMTLW